MHTKFIKFFSLLFLIHFICQLLQVPYFTEDGVYGAYTLSLLNDLDLNIFNQITDVSYRWLVTETFYHPDFEHSAISIFLLPFYGFYKVISSLVGASDNLDLYSSYMSAHIAFTVCVVLFALKFLKETFNNLSIEFKNVYLYIPLFCTPFFWYFFFESTSTNIFGFFYSSVVLFGVSKNINNMNWSWKKFFILGVVTSLGFIIRVQLLWVGVIYLFLQTIYVNRTFKKNISYILGFILPMVFYMINQYARGGGRHALFEYIDIGIKPVFINSFIGPNGYLVLAPFFLFFVFGYQALWKSTHLNRKLLLSLAIPAFVLFFLYNFSFALNDGMIGRHQLSFFPIFIIYFSFFDNWKNQQRIGVKRLFNMLYMVCFVWTIISSLGYFHINESTPWLWKFQYLQELSSAFRALDFISLRISQFGIQTYIYSSLLISPLLIFAAIIYSFVFFKSREKAFVKVFFCYSLTLYLLASISNLYFGAKNTKVLESEGFFKSSVVGKTERLFLYDDYVQVLRDSIRYRAMMGECTQVTKLKNILKRYLKDIQLDIIKDPINFKDTLKAGVIRKSNIEFDKSLEILNMELEKNCHL